jgi:hypothetical protein
MPHRTRVQEEAKMAKDIEELLRDGMRRATDEVRMAPDLAGRLTGQAARNRRRRTFAQAGVAAGTALAVAAGFAVAGALTAPPSVPVRAQNVAYVISRASRALAGTAGRSALAQVQWSFTGRTGAAYAASGWVYEDSPQVQELVLRWPASTVAEQILVHRDQETVTLIDFRKRIWTRSAGPRSKITPTPHSLCMSPAVAPLFISTLTLSQFLHCGDYAIAGRPRVDGVETIKLALIKNLYAGRDFQAFWLNASTYLPVRLLWQGPSVREKIRIDLRWLAVTPGNLTHLNVTVPAGFRRVTPSAFPG